MQQPSADTPVRSTSMGWLVPGSCSSTVVTVGRNSQPAGREVVLPPGTNHVEVHFAAVEISSPEKIRLQYRLDGVDSEWLDASPNPRAIYSNMPVGTELSALHVQAFGPAPEPRERALTRVFQGVLRQYVPKGAAVT